MIRQCLINIVFEEHYLQKPEKGQCHNLLLDVIYKLSSQIET